MLDWLIIGGGIQGTHLSLYLTRRRGVKPERLRVLDPYPEPLALWRQHTTNTDMDYLRSPAAHNLHYDPFSLITFARTRQGAALARFTDPYGRPTLELFDAHSRLLIERYGLDKMRVTGRAAGLSALSDGWRVETENGGIEAQRVILAFGNTERPHWPDWAVTLREQGAPINHIFEAGFDRAALPAWTQAVVVGGGITAVQTALAMAMQQPGTVTLLMRHPPRLHDFDADPGWINAIYLNDFHRERDYARRRAIIHEARHRGSLPWDVARDQQTAENGGLLVRRTGEITAAHVAVGKTLKQEIEPPRRQESGKGIQITLMSGDTLLTDRVILATGFETARPGGDWLEGAIQDYGLPLAPDGFPIADPSLCWSPGLYVSGALAELEVGPVARNIIGARLAAERIGTAA